MSKHQDWIDKQGEKADSVMGAFSVDSDPTFADLVDLIGLCEFADLDADDVKCWPNATCSAKVGRCERYSDLTIFTDGDKVATDVDGTLRVFYLDLTYTVESDGTFKG